MIGPNARCDARGLGVCVKDWRVRRVNWQVSRMIGTHQGQPGEGSQSRSRWGSIARRGLVAPLACALALPAAVGVQAVGSGGGVAAQAVGAAAAARPNIFFYNLDDLRDAFPGGIDPLQYMPKVRQWMAAGTRFQNTSVTDARLHAVARRDDDRPVRRTTTASASRRRARLRLRALVACYLARRRLRDVRGREVPHDLAEDQAAAVLRPLDGDLGRLQQRRRPRSTASRRRRPDTRRRSSERVGASTSRRRSSGSAPFFLYETPQAPHWSRRRSTGSPSGSPIPDTKYASAPVGPCAGVPEADRSDKPPACATRTSPRHRASRCARARCGRS